MKSYLLAHLFLAPFLTFTILAAFGFPLAGAILGLLLGIVFCAKKYGAKLPSVFMGMQMLGVLSVLVALVYRPELKESTAIAILFSFLAVGATISVITKKPWTAELSAGDYGNFAKTPAFIKSNIGFSAIWAIIFAWFAFANWQELAPIYRWIPMIVGALITIFGPKVLMNIGIKRGLFEDPRK